MIKVRNWQAITREDPKVELKKTKIENEQKAKPRPNWMKDLYANIDKSNASYKAANPDEEALDHAASLIVSSLHAKVTGLQKTR